MKKTDCAMKAAGEYLARRGYETLERDRDALICKDDDAAAVVLVRLLEGRPEPPGLTPEEVRRCERAGAARAEACAGGRLPMRSDVVSVRFSGDSRAMLVHRRNAFGAASWPRKPPPRLPGTSPAGAARPVSRP